MLTASSRGRVLEAFLFAVSSLVLFNIGVGIVLFLVPLQVAAVRRGLPGLLLSAAFVVAGAVGLRVVQLLSAGQGASWAPLSAVEAGAMIVALAGIVIVNLPALGRFRGLHRVLAGSLAAGVLSVPLILLIPGIPGFQEGMDKVFAEVSRMLQSFLPPAGGGPALLGAMPGAQELQKISVAYFLRSFLMDVFALTAFTWWAGTGAARLSLPPGVRPERARFSGFRLEGAFLWPLIGSWALILADLVFGISVVSYVAWNAGLVLLFLYGLQGLAILRFLMEKHHLPRLLWFLLLVVIVVLLFQPRGSLFVIVVIPAFGVSENWIRYRVREKLSPDQNGKE
jgi:hypothetical protein